MGGFKEYSDYDALGLAELVRNGDVTAEELCEKAIRRIEKTNPKLNAVVTPMYDIGRRTSRKPLPDGTFAGVPFLLKDLMFAFAGVPLTSGCKAYKNYVPDHDSEMVKRYKSAGLVILGKTNTPELGLLGITEPELFGPCRNPWNIGHTPGGSSGGSAAAVAAGRTSSAPLVPKLRCSGLRGNLKRLDPGSIKSRQYGPSNTEMGLYKQSHPLGKAE
jgi:amidase